MSEELDVDVYAEAYELTLGLRAHIELLTAAGAYGVPRAVAPIARSLSEPPPSLLPQPVPAQSPQPQGLGHATGPAKVVDWLASAIGQPPSEARAPAPPQTVVKTEPRAVVAPVAAKLSPEERSRHLEALANKLQGCQLCPLGAKRTQTVFSRGTGSSGLCFVGEGPGEDEDLQGSPFVGAAGKVLDSMIAAMGLTRDEVYVCNIVKCRPPENRKPTPSEMRVCMPYLAQQLELLAPEVIVALGATAVEGLLGVAGGITRLRGTWKLYQGRIAVMPTFHPAYLLRVPTAKHVVWEDMKAVLRQMGRPVPERGRKPQ